MIPGSFDIDTAHEMVGHERCAVIEADARAMAEAGSIMPSPGVLRSIGNTYFDRVLAEMDYRVWVHAHSKRVKRLERIGAPPNA